MLANDQMTEVKMEIQKNLSANDVGETGTHQAGLLIPKDPQMLSFFPALVSSNLNPKANLTFVDQDDTSWKFVFTHYNNKGFGGTRDEYRLTRMTKYLRQSGLVSGDAVIMRKHIDDCYSITYRRMAEPIVVRTEDGIQLQLRAGWKIIKRTREVGKYV